MLAQLLLHPLAARGSVITCFAQLVAPESDLPDATTSNWIFAAAFGAGALCVLAAWFVRVLRDRASGRTSVNNERLAAECLERLTDVIIVFRVSDERIVAANRAACDLYNITLEDITGRTLSQLERQLPMGKEQISRTIALGTSPAFVSRQTRPDGTIVSLEITAFVLDHEGERCVLSIGRDVSERESAAERARSDAAPYREVFESSLTASIVADAQSGIIVAANRAASALLDPAARGLCGAPVGRVLPGEARDAQSPRVVLLKADSRPVVRVRVERTDSTFGGKPARRYECRAIAGATGTPGAADDQNSWGDIFNSVLEAMVVVDPVARTVVLANHAAQRLYGYAPDEFNGVSIDRLTTDPQGCREICGTVLRSGEHSGALRYHRRKDASMVAVEANFSSVRFDGRTCVLCSMRQISAAAMQGRPIFTAEPVARADDLSARGPAMEVKPGKPGRHGRHLLVVDDEPLVREVTRRMLESVGFRVSTASDGATAIAIVASDPSVELVVLDVTMPGMLGPEVRRLMLEVRPELRVVLCSGYSSEAVSLPEMAGVGSEGSHGFVQKPFTLESLLAAVDAEVRS